MSKPKKTKTLQQIADVEKRLVQLRKQEEEAEATLRSLRESLSQGEEHTAVIPDHLEKAPTSIGKELSRSEKVSLFLRLFRGREDVYPRRWQNQRTGKEGYAPVCGNEWLKSVCEKPRVRCGECPNQAFLPVTAEAILDHLQGRHVMGVYPMLKDETCWFLAIDFDKEDWQEDVNSLAETSRRVRIPYAIERSRSGNGAHIWFFFDSPVPAAMARKMGSYLITETMARRHLWVPNIHAAFGR